MCVKLENNGQIIIPTMRYPIRFDQGTQSYEKLMTWGVDLGYGLIYNARIESILEGKWNKHGITQIGRIYVTGFFEPMSYGTEHRFTFSHPKPIGVIHNSKQFLVVTEPAQGKVKLIHHRQPCYLGLNQLKTAA